MEELVIKAQNGDKQAFIKLMNSYEKKLFFIAKSKLNNLEDVRDVIQETIYQCYKGIRKLKDTSRFELWILRILLNNCNLVYRKKNWINFVEYSDEVGQTLYSNGEISKKNDEIDFYNLIQLVEGDDKIIFSLYYCYEYSTLEIANILKINHNTVKSRLKRCREKIRTYIERCEKNE